MNLKTQNKFGWFIRHVFAMKYEKSSTRKILFRGHSRDTKITFVQRKDVTHSPTEPYKNFFCKKSWMQIFVPWQCSSKRL